MRLVIPTLALLVGCGGGSAGTAPQEPAVASGPLTPKEIVQRANSAIVRIEATGNRGEQVGTGFVLDKQGLVATNLHVIVGTHDIKIKTADGAIHAATEVVNIDPMRDLALLRFAGAASIEPLRLGDSSKVVTGDQIIAIGNPLGVFENTVSAGLVSSVRTLCSAQDVAKQSDQCPAELTLLQISAPISQGSSGGPLFNDVGEVIGVTTAINKEGQLINFAMPANYLKPLIAQPDPVSVEVFAAKTKGLDEPSGGQGAISRQIPNHPLSVLDGCKGANLVEVVATIEEAIRLGAPLYNAGNHEACFRIYENAVTKMEQGAACKGLRSAMGDGLLRASSTSTFRDKAWALRDTFDGTLIVIEKWVAANGALPTK
jgi:serine protease Do